MFEFSETKLFMDMVHGYIHIPRPFVKHIIDTELFQRLRNIDQTGIRIVYPDAKHDRFGHSLGVFHLGSIAVDALLKNFHAKGRGRYWKIRSDRSREVFWAKNKLLFLIACLLHDIGHAPFSHALELDMYRNSGETEFDQNLCSEINLLENDSREDLNTLKLRDISPHEKMGAMLVIKELKEPIKNILDYFSSESEYPVYNESPIFAEHYPSPPTVDSSQLSKDICFVVRMIMGLKYVGFRPEEQIKNCFIELLNGVNFDVDKLDYILRDTVMSGISNVGIDVERLVGAIDIVTQTEYKAIEEERHIPSHEHKNFIQEIYCHDKLGDVTVKGNITGILSLEKDTNVTIYGGTTIIDFKPASNEDSTISIDSTCKFDKDSIIHIGSDPTKGSTGEQYICITANLTPNPKTCIIKGATLLGEDSNTFNFIVKSGNYLLKLGGDCEIQIKGKFESHTPIIFQKSADRKGEITGKRFELTILRDTLVEKIPSESAYNTFSIGYHKQAINIISNVLDARDYLYLWIYAHHKVMYYANYLIPVIASALLKPSYNEIHMLDDSYAWTIIKQAKEKPETPDATKALIYELLRRKYKKSLFKSLAEYDMLFNSFSTEYKLRIFWIFQESIDPNLSVKGKYGITAGTVKYDLLKDICDHSNIDINNIGSLVWIDADYKRKKLDPKRTYIVFSNETTAMSKIELLNTAAIQTKIEAYFYLYCANEDCNDEIVNKLKYSIVAYFESGPGRQKIMQNFS